MKAIWDWLNGRKTAIGIVGASSGFGLELLGQVAGSVELSAIGTQVKVWSIGFAGLGALHKTFKGV